MSANVELGRNFHIRLGDPETTNSDPSVLNFRRVQGLRVYTGAKCQIVTLDVNGEVVIDSFHCIGEDHTTFTISDDIAKRYDVTCSTYHGTSNERDEKNRTTIYRLVSQGDSFNMVLKSQNPEERKRYSLEIIHKIP